MTVKTTVPQAGQEITLDRVTYIITSAFRMSDKGEKFQGQPFSDNVVINMKRPRGKRSYLTIQYPNGVYSPVM